MRRVTFVGSFTACLLAVTALGWVWVSSVFATNCNYSCFRAPACIGMTHDCPPCDTGVGDSCDSHKKEWFTPDLIEVTEDGPDQRVLQTAEAACYKFSWCQDVGSIPGEKCVSDLMGNAYSCASPGLYCTVCDDPGAWFLEQFIDDYTCPYCDEE